MSEGSGFQEKVVGTLQFVIWCNKIGLGLKAKELHHPLLIPLLKLHTNEELKISDNQLINDGTG